MRTHDQFDGQLIPPSDVVVCKYVLADFGHVVGVLNTQFLHTFLIATCSREGAGLSEPGEGSGEGRRGPTLEGQLHSVVLIQQLNDHRLHPPSHARAVPTATHGLSLVQHTMAWP